VKRALRGIFFSIALFPLLAFPSQKKDVRNYSWGTLQTVSEASGDVLLKLHMQPLQSGSTPVVFSRRVFYYALSPSQRIACNVSSFNAARNSYGELFRPLPGKKTSDSSTATEAFEPVPLNDLPSAPKAAVTSYGWFRGYYIARIEVTPFYAPSSQGNAFFAQSIDVRLTSSTSNIAVNLPHAKERDPYFDRVLRDLIVNYDDAQSYQMPQINDTTGGWFNTTSKYVKLAIPNDGIYRITRSQLQALYPAISGVDPRTFQVFDRGKEIPVYVSGESDGSFDASDYIEFPALRNYTGKQRIITKNLSEEYNEYLNRYTDTTFLWLTWGTTNGIRAASNPLTVSTSDTLTTYTAFIHLESQGPYPGLQLSNTDIYSQQDYRWNPHDIWPWDFLNGSGTATVNFNASDIAATSDSVVVYAKFASWGASVTTAAHKIAIRLNGSGDLSTVVLNRGDQAVLSGKSPAASLAAGQNSISLFSYPTLSDPNNVIYDWFEVEYPRQLKAVTDTLCFDFRTLPDRKLRNAQLTGLQSSDIVLYRVKPNAERIVNYSISASAPFTVTFCDTIGPQEEYILLPQSKVYAPIFKTIKNFTGLRLDKSQTDYIAITHSKFYPEATQYVQSVASSKHLTARLFNVDDIYDEFGFGYPTAEAIQGFVRSTFQWNSPVPSYLVLLGDASYDYKFYYGNFSAIDYVPSFGYPVSDVAYALVDAGTGLPQMYVGRIPVNNVGELTQYLSTYNSYQATQYDDWNKRFLFFSGGDPTIPGEIDLLKSVHDQIISTIAAPAPVGGIATHFYKTVNPSSNFGPYTPQQVNDAISAGGVFISYIGHSGTQTWDNSIGDPLQLKNSRGRYALITDFGCSTGKFAEPQITSFSEEFVVGSSASAIVYVGNSSLGFEGIATSLPQQFYSAMLKDSIVRVGETHLISKLRKISQEGLTTENGIMLYNNTMIGDPTVDLRIPFLPNLTIQQDLIYTPAGTLSDDQDSAAIKIVYANYGSVTGDSVDINVQHTFQSNVAQSWSFRRPMPLVNDTLTVYLDAKREPGEHNVLVAIDPENKISELSKSDNSVSKTFVVQATDFEIVSPPPMSVSAAKQLTLLTPESERYDPSKVVSLQIDTLADYSTAVNFTAPLGIVSASFNVGSLRRPARYYWRAMVQGSSGNWTTGTFYAGLDTGNVLGQLDSVEWQKNTFSHVAFSQGAGATIQSTSTLISLISSGFLDGKFGVIELNGVDELPSSFGRGHFVVVLDPVADTVVNEGGFDLYGNPQNADSLASMLNSVPNGFFVAAVIIDDGATNLTAQDITAYHTIGSKYIDSVGYRDSWAIFGTKGAPLGSALEAFKRSQGGKAIVETTLVHPESFGSIVTSNIGPVVAWKQLSIEKNVPAGTKLTTSLVGITRAGNADTLFASYDSSSVDLQRFSAAQYPSARLVFNLSANTSLLSPAVKSWSIRAQSPPELVISQNTVQLQKSTMQEGEEINTGVGVFNVGSSMADSITVSILSDDSGTPRTLKNAVIPVLNPGDSASITTEYNSQGKRGTHSFIFEVDPSNSITELYKSNNAVTVPYTVLADTIRPTLDVTFDNAHIADGDYVRAKPSVIFQVKDVNGTPISQSDTSDIYIELDSRQVFYNGNDEIQFSTGTPPAIAEVRWTPELNEGEHVLRYFAKDAAGNSSDTTLLVMEVTSKLELSNLYNIPNPFARGTTFTFTLTGNDDPQSAHIKIYTVAGRLIQDLDISAKVHIGANGYTTQADNLYWDGRDRDGNEIANGVYFYRVIINGGGQQTAATQKLVKMR